MSPRRIQAFVIATFLLVAACAAPLDVDAVDRSFRLVCQTSFRPDLTVPPRAAKQMELDIEIPVGMVLDILRPRDEVKAKHRDFVVVMSHDRGSVLLDIMDAKSNDHLHRWLWQFVEVPRNLFGGQGFTGLVYINHPQTGSELQLICKAEPVNEK